MEAQGFNFVPLVVERTGQLDASMAQFIKKVAAEANSRKGHDPEFFVHYWSVILSNVVAQSMVRCYKRLVRKTLVHAEEGRASRCFHKLRLADGHFLSLHAQGCQSV